MNARQLSPGRRLPLLGLFSLAACAAPRPPAELPTFPPDASWSSVTVRRRAEGGPSRVRTRFVSQGVRWRLEIAASEGRGLVAVYDGERLVTTSPVKDLSADDLDPRGFFRRLYDALAESRYDGEEEIDGHLCWRFEVQAGKMRGDLWVDQASRLPRRFFTDFEDVSADEQFFDLPADFTVTPDLFDADRLARKIERSRALKAGSEGSRAAPAGDGRPTGEEPEGSP